MEKVSFILPGVLKNRGLGEQAKAVTAVTDATKWLEGALPLVHIGLAVRKLENGVLLIEAQNAIALAECSQKVPELLAYLQSKHSVKNVRVLRV